MGKLVEISSRVKFALANSHCINIFIRVFFKCNKEYTYIYINIPRVDSRRRVKLIK